MYWNAVPTEEKQTISLVWESEATQMMVGLDLRLVFFELVITCFFFLLSFEVGHIPSMCLL